MTKKKSETQLEGYRAAVTGFLISADSTIVTHYIPDFEVRGCPTGGHYAMQRRAFLNAVREMRQALEGHCGPQLLTHSRPGEH